TTARGMFNFEETTKHIDIRNGGLVYMVKADLPARIEAAKLRELRRSVALKRMFEFQIAKKFDFMGLIPWIIIFMLILFK
ncbi:hypothetical protein, partial [Trinickia caryophylli]|uniref:hypothetical protein n=1 Tax=Trinickia caryophylli TaxID=28094 RepID=UPI000CAE07E9